ncbi:HXXEE domain-containing protein [Rhizobium sp. CG5]|uniref:HXXEE domain-containing protein n=1 Tax=Rhizobium sp. CG5 TaxID=2726076 RepID=UPI002033EA6B|nr:HXXEE domain-containing protein [Rhizobium sp. CG5]MCM2474823.1 HXXEE domain-containing protein [Rhizobium sp. CG5]
MDFESLCWLFAAALTLHNLEEAVYLPAWTRSAPTWFAKAGAFEFRLAAAFLTVLGYGAALLVSTGSGVALYFLCGYALAMLMNVLVPHVVLTLWQQRYMPGTATAVLFILPAAALLLQAAIDEDRISLSVFVWSGPATALGLALSLPLLFVGGRRLRFVGARLWSGLQAAAISRKSGG